MGMQIQKALLICGLTTGLIFSAYMVFIKLTGRYFAYPWRKGKKIKKDMEQEKAQKIQNEHKMLRSISSPKPLRMWIDGKCFNIKQYKRKTKQVKEKAVICTDANMQPISQEIEIEGIEYKNEIDVVTDDNGKHILRFQLPSIYYIKLHQFTEFDVNHLSKRTQTVISWPRYGKEGHLTIESHDKKNIEKAVDELHSVIAAIRERFTAAQFISIPILSPEVRTNFERFKSEILNTLDVKGMHESIFQSPLKLHLTVIVFALSDDREKAEAVRTFEEYKNSVLIPLLEKTGPLKLRIQGINCMQSDFKKTDVLYANVKILNETEELNLQKFVNGLANHFYERGLVLRHTENVKLHMTLLNTKYRKDPNSPSPSRKMWVKKVSFDASPIMEKYKDFYFGECDFDSIHLSLISTKGEDGFYKPMSVIKF